VSPPCGQHGEYLEVKLCGRCGNELISTVIGACGPSQNVPFVLSVCKTVLPHRKYGLTDSSCALKQGERHTLYYACFHCDEVTLLLVALQNSVMK